MTVKVLRRAEVAPRLVLLVAGIACVLLVALLVIAVGAQPIDAAIGLVEGALGEPYMVGETLVSAVPLALIALSVVPALRAGVFTVGSEGQMAMGALASAAFVGAFPHAPTWVLIAGGAVTGVAGGSLWALIPALLKSRAAVNEILSTLLLNYLAAFLLLWSLRTWLSAGANVPLPQSAPLPEAALLTKLIDGTRLHVGALLVPLLAIGLGWWLRTYRALSFTVFATHPALASRMGISRTSLTFAVFLFSGAVAGLAGWLQLAGVAGTLDPSIAGGLGFTGILIALLGGLTPIGIIVAAIVVAVLTTGASGLQAATAIPSALSTVIQRLVLLYAALVFAYGARRGRAVNP